MFIILTVSFTCTSPDTPPLNTHGSDSIPEDCFDLFFSPSCPPVSPLSLVGDDGGELEFSGKTGSLATTLVTLNVEGLSGVLHLTDDAVEERWSARELCLPKTHRYYC
uniref:Uncharacterized protein n=1 Tax=Cynoglossus semilaevis TaxID=244447 RepID=A0A3P8WE88_CYNSE